MNTNTLHDVIVTISGVPNTSKVLMQGVFAEALRQHGIAEVVYTDNDHTQEQIDACVAAQATEKHHNWENVRVTFLTQHLSREFNGRYLLAVQLRQRYDLINSGEHPEYTRKLWREEVASDDTLLGYWDWAMHQLEANMPFGPG